MNTELAQLFEKGIKNGLNGDIENYKNWLENHNINPKKLSTFSSPILEDDILNLIQANVLNTQQKEILNKIAEFLGIYLQNKENILFISIIGEYGVGKTHTLLSTKYGLDIVNYDLRYQFCDAFRLRKADGYYDEIYDSLTKDIDVLLIDSCEDNPDIINIITKFAKIIETGVIITTWTPVKYRDKRAEVKEIFNNLNEIEFKPFELLDTDELIKDLFKYLSIDTKQPSNKLNNNEFINLFHKYSKGIPRLLTSLLINSLYDAFLGKLKEYNKELIITCAKTLGMDQIPKFEELNKVQIDILKYIESIYDERGVRPSILKEVLELNKASLFYHLNVLKEKKILKSERIGKSSFYIIREELKPFIQRYLNQRREYYE